VCCAEQGGASLVQAWVLRQLICNLALCLTCSTVLAVWDMEPMASVYFVGCPADRTVFRLGTGSNDPQVWLFWCGVLVIACVDLHRILV
jgi:hypothetical protein